MVGVEEWAEVRRMHRVDGLSIREISKRTGLHRRTIRRALATATPPRYERAPAGSKLDPFKDWVCEQLRADPTIQAQRLREMAGELGYEGGKTIFDDYVREVRPRFLVRRTFQRTIYRPGELVQCELWEPRELIPVGHGQTRRRWVVTAELTTIRSTRCSPAVASRPASLRSTSPLRCSIRASWRVGTAARSPAGRRSPTRRIRASSSSSVSVGASGTRLTRDPAAVALRRADPGMTKAASELAHLFRALKAPAAAWALPALADRAREEAWSYEHFAEALLGTEVAARPEPLSTSGTDAPRCRPAPEPLPTTERPEIQFDREGRHHGPCHPIVGSTDLRVLPIMASP